MPKQTKPTPVRERPVDIAQLDVDRRLGVLHTVERLKVLEAENAALRAEIQHLKVQLTYCNERHELHVVTESIANCRLADLSDRIRELEKSTYTG